MLPIIQAHPFAAILFMVAGTGALYWRAAYLITRWLHAPARHVKRS